MTVGEAVRTLSPGSAARQLELKKAEFELAVQLGHIRTVPPGTPGAARRVTQQEIERLRTAPDFPEGMRGRVQTVGTADAADLLGVPPDRFTRLARTGHLSPVRFYLNRYRAVVWLYLAGEVCEFGDGHPELLTGRLPADVRARLAAGQDVRPRNWRSRRLGLLLRATDDPWEQAAAIASLLDPVQVAEVVDDPYERSYVNRLRPDAPLGRPESLAAREIADRLMLADDPDEILWHRLSLAIALDKARTVRVAPRPGRSASRPGGDTAVRLRAAAPPAPPTPPLSRRPTQTGPPGRRARGGLLSRLRLRKEARTRA